MVAVTQGSVGSGLFENYVEEFVGEVVDMWHLVYCSVWTESFSDGLNQYFC